MTEKSNVWVTTQDEGWAVKTEGSERAYRVTDTKEEAVEIGRELAKNSGVDLIVQRTDGTIQSRDSYGDDPAPPEDTEH